jgi:hypothetical protein
MHFSSTTDLYTLHTTPLNCEPHFYVLNQRLTLHLTNHQNEDIRPDLCHLRRVSSPTSTPQHHHHTTTTPPPIPHLKSRPTAYQPPTLLPYSPTTSLSPLSNQTRYHQEAEVYLKLKCGVKRIFSFDTTVTPPHPLSSSPSASAAQLLTKTHHTGIIYERHERWHRRREISMLVLFEITNVHVTIQ